METVPTTPTTARITGTPITTQYTQGLGPSLKAGTPVASAVKDKEAAMVWRFLHKMKIETEIQTIIDLVGSLLFYKRFLNGYHNVTSVTPCGEG